MSATWDDVLHLAAQKLDKGLYDDETGEPIILGWNRPDREQTAGAELAAVGPCYRCGTAHPSWEWCSDGHRQTDLVLFLEDAS